jgi:thiol-disulfide isomerase/thioredoxin
MIYSLFALLSIFFSPALNKNKAEVITLDQLQSKTIRQDNDSIYVVNFWATWCKPCVAELPYFEEAAKQFAGNNVKVVLVSLDFVSDKEKVNQFIENKNIQNDVYLLNAGDPNIWINKIDTSWSGGIPATVIYKKGVKLFFREGDFATQQELDSLLQTKIK